jgi:hypothetical protein
LVPSTGIIGVGDEPASLVAATVIFVIDEEIASAARPLLKVKDVV